MTRRSGVTVMELLLVLVLVGLTGTITGTMVSGAARAAERRAGALRATRTVLALGALLRHELHPATAADLQVTGPATVLLPRVLGNAPICGHLAATVWVRQAGWTGVRDPEGGRDHVRLLVDVLLAEWRELPIVAVQPAACPGGGAAWRLDLAAVPPGAPSHAVVLEPARLAAYLSGGRTWLGLARPGDPIEPFAGPLVSGGLTLAASGGALTAVVAPMGGAAVTLRHPVATP